MTLNFIRHSFRQIPTTEILILLLNLCTAFVIARALFSANNYALFYGWDGQSFLSFLIEHFKFGNNWFGFGSEPVIGLGNVSYPLNPTWLPSYLFSTSSDGTIDRPLAFSIGLVELFGATVFLARTIGFRIGHAVGAGWLLTVMTWPLYGFEKIVTLWCFFPHHAEIVALTMIVTGMILMLRHAELLKTLIISCLMFLALSYMLIAAPNSLILAIGVLGPISFCVFVGASSANQRRRILICGGIMLLVAVALGYVHFLLGLFKYTAAYFYPNLSIRYHTPWSGEISLLLWLPIRALSVAQIFTPERSFVGAGLLGAMVLAASRNHSYRWFGITVAVTETLFVGIGGSNYLLNYWIGPSVWYFELFLFPCFAISAVALISRPITRLMASSWAQIAAGSREAKARAVDRIVAMVIPLLLAGHGAMAIGPVAVQNAISSPFTLVSPFPQPQSEITRILHSEIMLSPGKSFRGRVAVMIGRIFTEERDWQRFSLIHYFAQLGVGNLHDGPGLWQDLIPTLFEYNALLSPANFVFERTFFTEPGDFQIRNLIGTRRIDTRTLALLGVRFVITDLPFAGATLRAQLTVPTPPEARKLLGFGDFEMSSFDLYLYELSDVNLGQFNPVQVRVTSDADSIVSMIGNRKLELASTAVTTERVPDGLVSAAFDSVTINRGGLHLHARSDGPSLLLLPFEFSRCLTAVPRAGTPTPQLIRVDLLLTGVLFNHNVDADIVYHTGPVVGARCRLADATDMEAIAIKDAFHSRPDLGVLRKQ